MFNASSTRLVARGGDGVGGWCWCDGVDGWRYKTAHTAWLETPVATSLIQCPLTVSLDANFEVTPEAIAKFFGWLLVLFGAPLEPFENKRKLAFGEIKTSNFRHQT